uniref:CCHC-type domain-containing protein n=1 Tax=Fagus sylvatica TaxID=28930 RepID=A0A2N9HPR0_FAGSY
MDKTELPKTVIVARLSSSSRNGSKYCKNCYKHGHLLFECPTVQCRYCHKIGHIVYNCPTKPPKPGHSGTLPRLGNPFVVAAAKASLSTPSLSSISVSELRPLVFSMVKQFMSTFGKISSAVSGNTWYFNSACCNHMSPDSQLFSSVIPTTHAPLIQTANGSYISASHTGSVSTPTLSLSDTYLIPNLTLNLISVGQLCELGYDLWFGSSGCRVQDPRTNQVLGTGRRVGRMFELTSLHLPSTPTPPPSQVAHTASVFPLSLWHLRLGHVSVQKLRSLVFSGFLGQVKHDSVDCVSCQLAKQPALSFNNSDSFSHTSFDLIHSDIWGPSPTATEHLSKMVGLNANTATYLTLLGLSSFLLHVLNVFWGEAALTAVYTINRLPSSALQNVTPFERLYAPPLAVNPVLDQTPDLPLADSPASPQEPAPPVDPACTNPLWQQAMIEELQALEKTHTWDLVDLPHGIRLVLLPRDMLRNMGLTMRRLLPLVARITSVRSLLAIAAVHQWPLFQMDVKNAFLNGDLTEEVYMQTPLGYSDYPDKVCLLRRALYGLKQAPRAWLSMPLTCYLVLGLIDTKVVSIPLEMNARLTPLDGTPLSDATLYHQLVGSLVYLTVTRPDIAHAVHLVSQFLSAPHSTHYAAVIHILRYIKGDPTDRHSTTGFCFFLGDSLISWRSKKQHIVSRSSTEAEYRALADTTSELLDLRWLLEDMGLTHSSPTVIHCDNRSAIQIVHNDIFHERTKHIEIDCHLVCHHLSAGIPASSSS